MGEILSVGWVNLRLTLSLALYNLSSIAEGSKLGYYF